VEYSGLVQKYPINRPLTDEERELQLKQKQRLDVEPHYGLGVIKMNSTYLELADKYYGFRGWLTFGMLLISGICLFFIVLFTHGFFFEDLRTPSKQVEIEVWLSLWLFMTVSLGGLLWVAIWGLRKESFWLTHLPIRLNRKTRMIHLFRPKRGGGILSVPWDDVFFTIGLGQTMGYMDVRGHILESDRATVRESFAISMPWGRKSDLVRMWEFMRRYMEDGPEQIKQYVMICLPIADRKESWFFGYQRLMLIDSGLITAFVLLQPLWLLCSLGRIFANWTSAIPQWPQEIEATCRIANDDAHVMDEGINGESRFTFWGWTRGK
jgi:hypothetical protein